MWSSLRRPENPPKATVTPTPSSPAQHRLLLLETAFTTRGLNPDEAHEAALRYVHGPGRGRNWITALAELGDPQPTKPSIREAHNEPTLCPAEDNSDLEIDEDEYAI